MKRLILAALAVCLAFSAHARVEERQVNDGTANYVGSVGDTGMCLGGALLTLGLDITTASTAYGVSPVTNAIIRDVWGVSNEATSGSRTSVRIYTGDNDAVSPIQFLDIETNTLSDVVLFMEPGNAGAVYGISTIQESDSYTDTIVWNTLEKEETIVVGSDGALDAPAGITRSKIHVLLCPR